MTKFKEDFEKIRGALLSQIQNNQKLSEELMKQFGKADYSLLEEHTLISKIILDSTRALTDAYKVAPDILKKTEKKEEINIDDLLED
jgi:ATP phosphoribosyltransferase regulatory subunit HisZ